MAVLCLVYGENTEPLCASKAVILGWNSVEAGDQTWGLLKWVADPGLFCEFLCFFEVTGDSTLGVFGLLNSSVSVFTESIQIFEWQVLNPKSRNLQSHGIWHYQGDSNRMSRKHDVLSTVSFWTGDQQHAQQKILQEWLLKLGMVVHVDVYVP